MGFERTRCTPKRPRGTRAGAPSPLPRAQASGARRTPAQDNETREERFLQQKFEATGLEIRERLGTLAPEEQDRLGTLRTSMQAFWAAWAEKADRPERGLPRAHAEVPGASRQEEDPAEATATLPGPLKAGLERFSGMDLSGVQVHYNSPRPARVGAFAYTKGKHIYAAPGQESRLPHEGWHVVQQLQGKVRPTSRAGGVAINNERILESEAQLMGTRAAQIGKSAAPPRFSPKHGLRAAVEPASAPVQGVLVNALGAKLSELELENLLKDYPAHAAEINHYNRALEDYIATPLRHGRLTIQQRQPPPARSFAFQVPPDVTLSSGSQPVWDAARHSGMNPSLARTDMKESLTPAIASSAPTGLEYSGASAIRSGRGLQESGLARTHHLSDKSIRVIIEWLHKHRDWASYQGGVHKVIEWMSALTGDPRLGDATTSKLLDAGTSVELEAIVNTLSNNPWNVGLGSGPVNRMIGPTFDESRTASGLPTPVASVIAQFTQYLRGLVPEDVIETALGQMVHRETGAIVHSMTAMSSGAPASAVAPVSTVPLAAVEQMTSSYPPPLPRPGQYRADQLPPAMVYGLVEHLARSGDLVAQFLFDSGPADAYDTALAQKVEFTVTPDGQVGWKTG